MHEQTSWTLAACTRILRPLVHLALAMGLKYSHLDGLLRRLLLEEATRIWQAAGVNNPNISQLSMTTGLNRKDVTARVRAESPPLPNSELSPAAKVFTTWRALVDQDPANRRLPMRAEPPAISFEQLARQESKGNVHHRSMLDDLIRLGMVLETNQHVELVSDAFVPARDLQAMLAFLGENTRDHLEAAVTNTLGKGPRMLERAVYADGLSQAESERLHLIARQRWDTLHQELVKEMTHSVARSGATGTRRIKVGIYALHEDEHDDNGSSTTGTKPETSGDSAA